MLGLGLGLNRLGSVLKSSAASIIQAGLQLWLDFTKSEWVGGELVVKDKSPNTNNAQLFAGKAMSFDGVNDQVDLGLLSATSDITIVMWLNLDDLSGSKTPVSIGETIVRVNNSDIVWYPNEDSTAITFSGVMSTGWHRLVITQTSTSCSLYINGLPIESATSIAIDTAFKNSYIGSYGPSSWFFEGGISDLQLYGTAWDSDDVAFDYNNPNLLAIDNPDSNLVAADLKGYWALSEGAGSIAYDSSGQGNNGTIIGATYVDKQDSIPQLGMMDWAKSTPVADEITLIQAPNNVGFDILGNALRLRENSFNLDGSGYAEVADDASLDVTDFTCSGWAKYSFLNTGSSWNVIYANGSNGHVAATFDVATETGGKLVSYISTIKLTSTSTFTEDEWFYFAVTRSGSDISMYINGNTTPEATGTQSASVNNALPKYIGRDASTNRFYKNLTDGILIYNRALTATEITNNYNVGLEAHTTPIYMLLGDTGFLLQEDGSKIIL